MIEAHIGSIDDKLEAASCELAELFQRRRVTIFAGAGVSIPSGLPDSPTLIKSISRVLLESLKELRLVGIEDLDTAADIIAGYRLEPILDAIVRFHGNSGIDFLSCFGSAQPSYDHHAAAILASQGYLDNIITLNFDPLFEMALQRLSVPFTWHLPLASVYESPKHSPTRVKITKPHGTLPVEEYSYDDYYLAATLQYAGDHPQEENIRAIIAVSKESPVLLVCGYANMDWDMFPILSSVPWERVYWIQHSDRPPQSVVNWLGARKPHTSWLLFGDVQLLLMRILEHFRITDNVTIGTNLPMRNPDLSSLVSKRAATAFAAVSLLAGKKNMPYRSMLAELGRHEQIVREKRLLEIWEREMAWSYHVHERDPHKAIRRYRRVIPLSLKTSDIDLDRLSDCLSMYYEYISTLKRFYVDLLLPLDIFFALKWRRELLDRVGKAMASQQGNPWVKKEVGRLLALTRYFVLDVYHNWGYHLLLFANPLVRNVVKRAFRKIARLYDALAKEHPDIDWEYHFVRRVEAHLLALNATSDSMKVKLKEVCDMFDQTGQSGHLAYTKSVLAVVQSDLAEFLQASKPMSDGNEAATPTGTLRVILLQRYFWPNTISGWATLRSLLKYSKPGGSSLRR